MAKPAARLTFLQVALALGAVVVLGRAFQIQVLQHKQWATRAEARDVRTRELSPRRGGIYDRDGTPLAATYEAYHVKVALNELIDPAGTRKLIQRSLGIPAEQVSRQFRNRYPYFDGPFDATQVQPLRGVRGIHLEPLLGREHPMGNLARAIVGRTDREAGRGIEGVEAMLDSLLAGTPGSERILVDGAGRYVPIPDAVVVPPRAGHDVLLTIDHEVQGIAEGALARAVERFRARGGDIVILDIENGEVIASASLRSTNGGALVANAGALIEPNEPGSTAKIFTAAALLVNGTDLTPVSGEGGVWQMPVSSNRTRTIVDTHREDGELTLPQTIQVSSNIAISKFAMRLTGEQQFTMLRSFGFGTAPGTGFPVEASGLLRRPAQSENLRYTMPSWAQGYEFTASALQIATAYAAIANGGTLLAPTLVREVRTWPEGEVVWRHRADTVRRVLDQATADELMGFLRLAIDEGGTGRRAQLDRWEVIGKTGTAKLAPGVPEYRGAFAGIFPGQDPRFVIYVMIDRPGGAEYYGGLVAAPLVRNLLVQALALPNSPLEPSRGESREAIRPVRPELAAPQPDEVRRLSWPLGDDEAHAVTQVTVPELAGWRTREAVHQLHRTGLKVRLVGSGLVVRTDPLPGDTVATGSTVTLIAGAGR